MIETSAIEMNPSLSNTSAFARPYVISWNLTYRCNLACEHCYLDAGGTPLVSTENFTDRSELGTEECFRVIDEIASFAPECLTILTGGEPLLRRDILEIVRRAAERELWVVVGTNGVRISENVAQHLSAAGARGLSLSLDALDPDRHDRFRRVRGAWQNTVDGAAILNRTGLPFIVQTTAGSHNLGELDAIADFAYERLAAKVWNLYFLVPTGRGQFVSDITPTQYDDVARVALSDSAKVQRSDAREREVRAALHQDRSGTRQRRSEPDRWRSGRHALRRRSGQALRRRSGQALGARRVSDQDLLRRCGRMSGRHTLHGDTAKRRCDALSLSPGLRGNPAHREPRGLVDVVGAVLHHSAPVLA